MPRSRQLSHAEIEALLAKQAEQVPLLARASERLAEMIKNGREFWDKNNRLINDRVAKYPEDVELAVTRFREAVTKGVDPKEIDGVEKTILELAERERKLNTRWAGLTRKEEEFDKLELDIIEITDGFQKRLKAEAIWRELIELAKKCESRADTGPRAGRIDLEYDGDADLMDGGGGPTSSGDPRKSFIQLVLRGSQQEHDETKRRISRRTFDKFLSELKSRFLRRSKKI